MGKRGGGRNVETISFKCPNCGGELLFDPERQDYHCEYCESRFSEEELSRDAEQEKETAHEEEEGVVYSCPNCGAQIVTEETTAATFCFYCHNPVILTGRLSGEFLPDWIIPFKISKEKALNTFLDWAGKRKFVPRDLFRKENLEKISGVYFPYWMVDYNLKGHTMGRATKVRVWCSRDMEYTETTEYELEREGTASFKNYGQNALRSVHTRLLEGVMPFRPEECVPFKMSYLTGFLAEKRDIERKELEKEMEERMKRETEQLFENSECGYMSVRRTSEEFQVMDTSWKYALFPVWVLTYREGSRIRCFAMNGQTGEIRGELPLDRKKLKKSSLIWGAAAFFIVLIGGLVLCL